MLNAMDCRNLPNENAVRIGPVLLLPKDMAADPMPAPLQLLSKLGPVTCPYLTIEKGQFACVGIFVNGHILVGQEVGLVIVSMA